MNKAKWCIFSSGERVAGAFLWGRCFNQFKNYRFNFKKTAGASAYQVQYRLAGKKWASLAKSTKKLKVTSKKLKKGKKYSFRVRTISKVNGKTVYGKWTAAKTVKIK